MTQWYQPGACCCSMRRGADLLGASRAGCAAPFPDRSWRTGRNLPRRRIFRAPPALPRRCEPQGDGRGPGVLDRVVHGFLGDPVEPDLDVAGSFASGATNVLIGVLVRPRAASTSWPSRRPRLACPRPPGAAPAAGCASHSARRGWRRCRCWMFSSAWTGSCCEDGQHICRYLRRKQGLADGVVEVPRQASRVLEGSEPLRLLVGAGVADR